jgi:hypothetical protein
VAFVASVSGEELFAISRGILAQHQSGARRNQNG